MPDPATAELAAIDADLRHTWTLIREADTVERWQVCMRHIDALLDKRLAHRRSAPQ